MDGYYEDDFLDMAYEDAQGAAVDTTEEDLYEYEDEYEAYEGDFDCDGYEDYEPSPYDGTASEM